MTLRVFQKGWEYFSFGEGIGVRLSSTIVFPWKGTVLWEKDMNA